MHDKYNEKLKSYRFGNFLLDLFFGTVLGLLSLIGSIILYNGCLSANDFFHGLLKDKWELIALPIGIIWLYFNLKGIFYILYMVFSKVQKEIVRIDKVVMEKVTSTRRTYHVWNAYYPDGVFELQSYEAKKIERGKKVEIWFKPERKGKRRRTVAVYI
jgi:hypothetical protein